MACILMIYKKKSLILKIIIIYYIGKNVSHEMHFSRPKKQLDENSQNNIIYNIKKNNEGNLLLPLRVKCEQSSLTFHHE